MSAVAAACPVYAPAPRADGYARRCGGRLRIPEIAKKSDDISRILSDLGYSSALPRAPPRTAPEQSAFAHGQLRLAFG